MLKRGYRLCENKRNISYHIKFKNFVFVLVNSENNVNNKEKFKFDQSVTVISAYPIINAIAKYKNHPSVNNIRNKEVSSVYFSIRFVEEKEIKKTLRNLSKKKACLKSSFPLI